MSASDTGAGETSAAGVPTSTYRLQIRPGFDLFDAAGCTDYIRSLGVGWLYLSPLLDSNGSEHGYDTVDHGHVDPQRGGAAGLDELAGRARACGLGILVDIVPNHMGVAEPVRNPWWWELLRDGPAARTAEAFDVDWEAGGDRIRIPVVGDDDESSIAVDGDRSATTSTSTPSPPARRLRVRASRMSSPASTTS